MRLEEHDPERLAVQRRRAEHVGPRMRRAFSSSVIRPSHSMRGVAGRAAAQRPRSRDRRRRSTDRTFGGRSAHGFEQHGQALARLVAPDEEDGRRPSRRPRRGLGERVDLDPVERAARSRRRARPAPFARRRLDTAHRMSSRRASQCTIGLRTARRPRSPRRHGTCRPAARLEQQRGLGRPGASGSCRWTTSKASSRRARMVRSWAEGSGAMGATEPLAAVGTLLPSGVTPASGGGPSQGASTRTSWPSWRRVRANPST